jgi:hypothetical protein
MIQNIINLLQEKDYYNVSKDIDVAKGKYEIPSTWKGVKNLFKRM